MDKLIEKIIEKTELKNWTLFLFIFAISFTVGLRLIAKAWFHLPDEKFNQTTLFLLEVFLSSLTITRFLVAIKFLEAVNRTPIIADIINWVVVERRLLILSFHLPDRNRDDGTRIETRMGWSLGYEYGVTENEAWFLINDNFIIDDGLPDYKRCKKAIGLKTTSECADKKVKIGYCIFTLNPALYRGWDIEKYGFWILKRQFCLEHFILAVCGGVIGILIIKGCIAIGLLICRCMF